MVSKFEGREKKKGGGNELQSTEPLNCFSSNKEGQTRGSTSCIKTLTIGLSNGSASKCRRDPESAGESGIFGLWGGTLKCQKYNWKVGPGEKTQELTSHA